MAEEKNECVCGGKKYTYVGFNMSLDICYKCGKFHCKTGVRDDDFINFIEKHSDLIPHLIEMKYLVPT